MGWQERQDNVVALGIKLFANGFHVIWRIRNAVDEDDHILAPLPMMEDFGMVARSLTQRPLGRDAKERDVVVQRPMSFRIFPLLE